MTTHESRWRRVQVARIGWVMLKVLAGAITGLAVLYLVGVNVLLNSSVGVRLMNSHPEVVRIGFQRAWTVWPGCVHVSAAEVSGQDSEVQYAVTADKAQITFTAEGISHKDVTATQLRGEGVAIRIRRRMVQLPAAQDLAKLPEIKGFPSPLKPEEPDVRVIGVRLQDMAAHHVREIWVDGFRATGDFSVTSGIYFKPRRALRIDPSVVIVHAVALTTGGVPILTHGRGAIAVTLDNVALAGLSRSDLVSLTGSVDLLVGVEDVRFVQDLLPGRMGITLDAGGGELAVAVQLDRGVLRKGSNVQYNAPQVRATLPVLVAQASLFVDLRVAAEQTRADFAVEFGSVVLARRFDGKADVHSKIIQLKGTVAPLDFSSVPTLDIRAELPKVTANDLTFLNDLLPASVPIRLDRGAGTLSGHFHFNTGSRLGSALLDLDVTHLSLQNRSAHLQGRVRLQLRLRRFGLHPVQLDPDGSWLALDDFAIHYDHHDTQHWKGRIELTGPAERPRADAKLQLDTMLHVDVKNLQPVVGVIATNLRLPWIAKALSDIEDLKLDTHVQLAATSLRITDVEVRSDQLSVQGQLVITDLRKPVSHQDGFLLVKLGLLHLGIEIQDGGAQPILVRPQHWFEAREAAATAD